MPNYRYQAVDEDGKRVKGRMSAANEAELHALLLEQELYLTRAAVTAERKKGRPLKAGELSEFSRELGTMLQSGIPLVKALAILSGEEGLGPDVKRSYEQLLKGICRGQALSEAMERQTGVFPELMRSMFCAAEISGNLDRTALLLAGYYSREHKLEVKTKNAVIYPKLLSALLLLVIGFLLCFVLPQFESLFSLMEELPWPTRILYAAADFLTEWWYLVVIGALGIGLAGRAASRILLIRKWLDWAKLHTPVFGRLEKTVCTARFARVLSSLYSAGIPIASALQIARKTVGNSYIDAQFDRVIFMIRSGSTVSDSLDTVDGFLQKLSAAARVGEESGKLDSMLVSMADSMEYDAEQAVGKMVAYLEPLVIVVMAVIVGGVMAAVMLPVYESYHAIERAGF